MGSELSELLARVEAASGPDRGIDARIYAALVNTYPHLNDLVASRQKAHPNEDAWKLGAVDWRVKPYTASVDAALALVERVLPDHDWIVEGGKSGSNAVLLARVAEDDGPNAHTAQQATPALAICAALLLALASTQPAPARDGEPHEGGDRE
ncbi:MAG: hypothetical protein Q8R82_06675 [Hyphomonadaceae bacterium]|nr:hypothetical protein [Hyphomonadaceae bacterium]